MFYIVPRNQKAAKTMLLIISGIFLILLIVWLVFWGLHQYRLANYAHIDATVTEKNMEDRKNTWTEFQYEYEGNSYVVREKGIFTRMDVGSSVPMLVNPQKPAEATILEHSDGYAAVVQKLLPFFGLVTLLYLIVFLLFTVRLKKQSQN